MGLLSATKKQLGFISFFLFVGCLQLDQKAENSHNWLDLPSSPATIFKQLTPEECEHFRYKSYQEGCINEEEYNVLKSRLGIPFCAEKEAFGWKKCPFETDSGEN